MAIWLTETSLCFLLVLSFTYVTQVLEAKCPLTFPNGYVRDTPYCPRDAETDCSEFGCNEGFRKVFGANVLICNASTQWTTKTSFGIHICINVNEHFCPSEIRNGHIDRSCFRRHKDVCSYFCISGCTEDSSVTKLSCHNGTWGREAESVCIDCIEEVTQSKAGIIAGSVIAGLVLVGIVVAVLYIYIKQPKKLTYYSSEFVRRLSQSFRRKRPRNMTAALEDTASNTHTYQAKYDASSPVTDQQKTLSPTNYYNVTARSQTTAESMSPPSHGAVKADDIQIQTVNRAARNQNVQGIDNKGLLV